MLILMRHPKEGEKSVYLDDIAKHRADGWVNADEFVTPNAPVATPATDTPRKPGRPKKAE